MNLHHKTDPKSTIRNSFIGSRDHNLAAYFVSFQNPPKNVWLETFADTTWLCEFDSSLTKQCFSDNRFIQSSCKHVPRRNTWYIYRFNITALLSHNHALIIKTIKKKVHILKYSPPWVFTFFRLVLILNLGWDTKAVPHTSARGRRQLVQSEAVHAFINASKNPAFCSFNNCIPGKWTYLKKTLK